MWPVPLVPLPGAPGEWVEVMSEQRKSGGLCHARVRESGWKACYGNAEQSCSPKFVSRAEA